MKETKEDRTMKETVYIIFAELHPRFDVSRYTIAVYYDEAKAQDRLRDVSTLGYDKVWIEEWPIKDSK